MKILMINKFYYIKGGSETYLFNLKKILEKNGHKVIPFAMKDEKNEYSEYEKYFINNIDYNKGNLLTKISNATKIIYNFDAKRKLEELLQVEKPDVAHLHLFQHQISPSILKVLKKYNIPIVYTVHDLKPVCLNYKMLNNNGLCEKCISQSYIQCLKNKCVKNSYLFSAINVIEGYLHKYLKSYELIDIFITPSQFYKNKLIQAGIQNNKVVHIPNFINLEKFSPEYESQDYFIYVGRLSDEKGIETLIKSMKYVKKSVLKIIGTGPLKEELEKLVFDEKIENVEFLGFKSGEILKNIIRHSKFVIIPSEWYENGPMSVIEAMALGKPIIGSNIGGIPEMITNEINGCLFEPRDCKELSECINNLLKDESRLVEMGKESRKYVEKLYNEAYHFQEIMKIYEKLSI